VEGEFAHDVSAGVLWLGLREGVWTVDRAIVCRKAVAPRAAVACDYPPLRFERPNALRRVAPLDLWQMSLAARSVAIRADIWTMSKRRRRYRRGCEVGYCGCSDGCIQGPPWPTVDL
jgi:hypothetical protein